MRKVRRIAGAAAALLVIGAPAAAQNGGGKIGYVNSQKIISEAPGAKEAQDTFEKEMTRYRTELESLEAELKGLLADYEQKQVMLSPEVKKQKEDAIRAKQRTYQQRAGELEQTAAQRQEELVAPIMKRIEAVIEEVRKEAGYTIIFDAAAGGIAAADPAHDLTDAVLTRLKATAAAAPSQP